MNLFEQKKGDKSYLELADEKGWVEVDNNVYLSSQKQMIEDQKEWPDDYTFKTFDFTVAPYWADEDHLDVPPNPIHTLNDLDEYFQQLNADKHDEMMERWNEILLGVSK